MAIINTPTTNPTSPILSSTGIWSNYNDASNQLDKFTSGADPYAQLFEQLTSANAKGQDVATANATATAERSSQQLQQNESQYNAGLATEGVQSGANRYLPTYQAGLVEQAHQNYMSRYQAIDNAEKLAIAAAQAAKADGDVKVLKEKLDYANQLRKAKADALQKANDMQWEQQKFKQQMALQWAQENRLNKKDTAESTTNTERVQTNVLQPTTHQLRRLQNNGVPLDALQYIQAQIAKGYSFEEAFAGLGDAQSEITPRGRTLIKKFIKPI